MSGIRGPLEAGQAGIALGLENAAFAFFHLGPHRILELLQFGQRILPVGAQQPGVADDSRTPARILKMDFRTIQPSTIRP
jgi:hypothetical protein